jgi:hypothetical protein
LGKQPEGLLSRPLLKKRRAAIRTRQEQAYMKGYKAPSFQDRAAASSRAKETALAQMKAAPQPDAAELAARAARGLEREALAAAKAAKAQEARQEKQRLAEEKKAEAKRQSEMPAPAQRTEAEQKLARDARYAARKARK